MDKNQHVLSGSTQNECDHYDYIRFHYDNYLLLNLKKKLNEPTAYRVFLNGYRSISNNATIQHSECKLFKIIRNLQKPIRRIYIKFYTISSPHTPRSIVSSYFIRNKITLHHNLSNQITQFFHFSHPKPELDGVNRLKNAATIQYSCEYRRNASKRLTPQRFNSSKAKAHITLWRTIYQPYHSLFYP